MFSAKPNDYNLTKSRRQKYVDEKVRCMVYSGHDERCVEDDATQRRSLDEATEKRDDDARRFAYHEHERDGDKRTRQASLAL